MGLLGYGAVRGMKSSLKMNKEQLKKKRLTAKEIAKSNPAQGSIDDTNKEYDEKEVALFNQKFKAQKLRQKKLKIITLSVFILLGIITLALLFM